MKTLLHTFRLKAAFMVLVMGVGALTACDNFLDVNDDPANPQDASPEFILPGLLSKTNTVMRQIALAGPLAVSQQVSSIRPNSQFETYNYRLSNQAAWQTYYFSIGGVADQLYDNTPTDGAFHYRGTTRIIDAINLGMMADFYGPAPYSDAFGNNPSPNYDSVQVLYQTIQDLLDEAIIDLQRGSTIRLNRQSDYMYNGDRELWRGLAFGIKARYYNHLTNFDDYDPQLVLQMVDLALESLNSNAANADFSFTSVFQNPWSVGVGSLNEFSMSELYANYMNGTLLGALDPRIENLVFPAQDGEYMGIPSTQGVGEFAQADFIRFYNDPNGDGNLQGKFFTQNTSPYPIFTYYELRFIEAEAAFLGGDATRAFQAYIEGIRAFGEYIGTPETPLNSYINSAAVADDANSLTLSDIMVQKYIALFLQPEVWTDLRRYDYDATIYPGLAQPATEIGGELLVNEDLNGLWPERLNPNQFEVQYNAVNLERQGAFTETYIAKPIWWARGGGNAGIEQNVEY